MAGLEQSDTNYIIQVMYIIIGLVLLHLIKSLCLVHGGSPSSPSREVAL